MIVKELIEKLQKKDPNMIVMIEQGEEANYMIAFSVKEKEIEVIDDELENEVINAVVIEYS